MSVCLSVSVVSQVGRCSAVKCYSCTNSYDTSACREYVNSQLPDSMIVDCGSAVSTCVKIVTKSGLISGGEL